LVADVVPLRDENRVLVRRGLDRMTAKPSVGIHALMEAAKLSGVKSEDVAFRLAPRINAAGRLGCARMVVELLTTANTKLAKEHADYLEAQNAQRQAVERKISQQAREMVEANGYETAPAIVLGSTEWHAGVVGIVAGRLAEQYARPVLVAALKENDEVSTGSGRSIPGFALHEALRACDGELLGHGGHAAAAGFKVKPSRLEALRAKFAEHAASQFPEGLPAPRLRLDAEVPIASLTFGLLKDIDKLEPYGADNPRPRFLASGLTIEGTPRRIGTGERHLSFRVRQGGNTIRAVAFGMGERLDELMCDGGRCCLAFTPKVNEWNGSRSVEIEVVDFQPGMDAKLG
jgi:single-stranded-DNA-specific exonuclease